MDIGNAVFVEYLGFGDDARFVKRKAAVAADVVKIGRGFLVAHKLGIQFSADAVFSAASVCFVAFAETEVEKVNIRDVVQFVVLNERYGDYIVRFVNRLLRRVHKRAPAQVRLGYGKILCLKAKGFVDAGIIGRRLVQNFLRQGKRVGSHGNFAEIKSRAGILHAFEAEIAHSGQRNADSCILQGLFAFFTDFLLKFNNFSFLFLAFLCFIIFDIQRNCPDFLLCAEL